MVFKSLEELAKCHQKILWGHTCESKHVAYRHILKTVVKVLEEKFKCLCFSSLPAIRRADPPLYPQGVEACLQPKTDLSRTLFQNIANRRILEFWKHTNIP